MSTIDLAHQTFSNSWYRVYELRCALRPSVKASKQVFGGETWIVLNDAMSNEWFRVTPEVYAFLSRLHLDQTVETIWYVALEENPDTTLSQEEIVQVLGQLHLSNMLVYDQVSDADSFFERFTTKRRKERMAKLMGFLSIKIPLLDPDRALNTCLPFIRLLFNPIGLCLYFALLGAGLLTAIGHHERLFDSTQGVLAPDNLLLLYIGFAIAKTIHELGHAALCKYYGGEVHILGVMLILFTPIPYCDASSSWGFRHRSERLWVASAGMLFELAVASVALLIWASTAPGTLNALCYNIVFTASVSTLLFNSNPLLRFDGYHMLVDLLNMPNLFANSRNQLKYLASRYILRSPSSTPAAQSPRESLILPTYGVLSLTYWLLLMVGILTFVANQYLDLGMLMAILLVIMIAVIPLFKLMKYLLFDQSLARTRGRTLGIVLTWIALIAIPVVLIPVPQHVRVSGVIEATRAQKIFSETGGHIITTSPQNGTRLNQGDVVLQLANPELQFQIDSARAKQRELFQQLQLAQVQNPSNIRPLQEQLTAVQNHLENLAQQERAQTVYLPMGGIWAGASDAELYYGKYVPRGSYLGIVTQPNDWQFVGVLPQIETHVFSSEIQSASIKIHGQAFHTLAADTPAIVPFDNGQLPSPALGMAGGGSIAVDPQDPQGLTAIEPFFRIETQIDVTNTHGVELLHGALATLRMELTPTPLIVQLQRQFSQYLQQNFRI